MNGEEPKIQASAVVLTGGKSSRMGSPKALLPFDGEPLVLHIVRKLKELFPDIVVVAAPDQELPALPVTLVRDEVAYQGPVGGIYHGLRAAGNPVSFVTSCDVPFLNLPFISHLLSRVMDYDVVVPHWEGRLQPLHAAYRTSVAPLLQQQLERGELRPIFLYEKVRTCKVEESEIRRFDPEGLSFLNMNTPADYELAVKRWQEERQRIETETVSRQRVETETASAPAPISVSVPVSNSSDRVPVTVELFGVARLRAKTAEVPLELPQNATLAHVFRALADRLPTLVGSVIAAEKDNLATGHACNINGRDFVRSPSTKVNPGDRIFILSADAGG